MTRQPSGALGTPSEVIVLAVGDARRLRIRGVDIKVLGMSAGHSLLKLGLSGPLEPALGMLRRAGHPIAGQDPKTRRFFAEKALLVRPFIHVSRAGAVHAPLHGDLKTALDLLGTERANRPTERPGRPPSKRGPKRDKGPKGRGGRGTGRGRS